MNSPTTNPADDAANPAGNAVEKPPKPDDVLPPVQPPSSAFILQLFLIPMIIVSIIVCVWLMFSWLAHMGNDPHQLVEDIRKMNSASWQKALVLANMLRNKEYDHLKEDPKLAGELGDLLAVQLKDGGDDDRSIKLRRFLCRALGEFRTPQVMPVLLKAASQESNQRDVEVRRSALAAIAILTSNVGPEKFRDDEAVLDTLIAASRERDDTGPTRQERSALRSTAAFALGVVGGEKANTRLAQMTIDSEADVRYNAAIGLARNGDERAIPVLLQMLDPKNEQAVAGETSESARIRKRLDVMSNAIRAVVKLQQNNPQWDPKDVSPALQKIADDGQFTALSIEAKEALTRINSSGNKD